MRAEALSKATTNARAALLQGTICGAILIALYASIFSRLGADYFGVWVLLLAVCSVVNVGELGFSNTLVHLLVQRTEQGRLQERWSLIVDAVSYSLAAQIVLAALIYPIVSDFLALVAKIPEPTLGHSEILLALSVVILGAVAKILLSSVDGIGKTPARCLIKTGGSVVLLALALLLMPDQHLTGLLLAQLGEVAVLIGGSVIILTREHSVVDRSWPRVAATKVAPLLGLAKPALCVVMIQALIGPITKALISLFGGIKVVGFFELSNRLLVQGRGLLVAAHRGLLPNYSGSNRAAGQTAQSTFLAATRTNTLICLPGFLGLAVAGPLGSLFFLGMVDREFVLIWQLLCGAWLISTLALPGFYFGLGQGNLRTNLLSHLLMLVLVIAFSVPLGWLWGPVGVVTAYVLALTIGSIPMIIKGGPKGLKRLGLQSRKVDGRATGFCLLGTLLGISASWFLLANMEPLVATLLPLILFLTFSLFGYWPLARKKAFWVTAA